MTVEIVLDPWRGGYEIRDDEGTLVLVDSGGHGGPRLAGVNDPRELPAGELMLPFRSDGPDAITIECDGQLLRIGRLGAQLQVRLRQFVDMVTVRHEDFKG